MTILLPLLLSFSLSLLSEASYPLSNDYYFVLPTNTAFTFGRSNATFTLSFSSIAPLSHAFVPTNTTYPLSSTNWTISTPQYFSSSQQWLFNITSYSPTPSPYTMALSFAIYDNVTLDTTTPCGAGFCATIDAELTIPGIPTDHAEYLGIAITITSDPNAGNSPRSDDQSLYLANSQFSVVSAIVTNATTHTTLPVHVVPASNASTPAWVVYDNVQLIGQSGWTLRSRQWVALDVQGRKPTVVVDRSWLGVWLGIAGGIVVVVVVVGTVVLERRKRSYTSIGK